MQLKSIGLSALLGFACLASPALAGQSWLAASDWEPSPGEQVTISTHAGSGFQGDSTTFAHGSEQRLLLRQAAVETPGWAGMERGVVSITDDDGTLVAHQSEPATLVMDGPRYDDHLREEGLDLPLRMRMASGASAEGRPARERLVSCDKLWIGGDDGRRIREAAGLDLELVPRRDPSRVSRVRVQLLFRGKPLSNALVKMWRQPLENDGSPTDPARRFGLAPVDQQRTDAFGRVRLDVAPRGEYLVSAWHAAPFRDPHVADWNAWRASLTFARGAGRAWEGSDQPRRLRHVGLGSNPDLGDPGFSWSTTVRDWPGWSKK